MQIVARTGALPVFASSGVAGGSRGRNTGTVRTATRETRENDEADAERVMQEVSMDVGDESMDVED